jgi:hypothetical protein
VAGPGWAGNLPCFGRVGPPSNGQDSENACPDKGWLRERGGRHSFDVST